MSWLAADGLRKCFPDGIVALDDVSFEVQEHELFCIVGPTNAGKSTLLKTIAGLHRPDAGRIRIAGEDVTDLPPKDRRLSLLFQNIALFPTLTGFENIAFPLRTAGVSEADTRARVAEVASMLRIDHLLGRLPRTFSGGEQQRVAIGRALAHSSRVLMLDEPLTNLDARIRIALRIEFKTLHRDTGQTMLYVTHDQVEAMSLSDRIAVLNEGRVEQVGTPDEIYGRPATQFVAQFIGTPPMNILIGELTERGGRPMVAGAGFEVGIEGIERLATRTTLPRRIGFGIRPEAIRIEPARSAAADIEARVLWVERLGSRHVLDVGLGDATLKVSVRPDHPVASEGAAWLGFHPQAEHLLDPATGKFFR